MENKKQLLFLMIQLHINKMLDTANGKLPLDVSLTVNKGDFLSIYGNSGAGKTTLLRIIAGLTVAEKATIKVADEIWDDDSKKFI